MIKAIISIIMLSSMFTFFPVDSDSVAKPFMDYRTITDYTSVQYNIVSKAKHEFDGTLTVDGYTCVALGQQYGKVGDKFIIVINDKKYKVILADVKKWCDTENYAGWCGVNGHVVEFVVDSSLLSEKCKILGDCNDLMPGKVDYILKINH